MSDLPAADSYQAPTGPKLLVGIVLVLCSFLLLDGSLLFRLVIGFGGAINILEVGARVLASRYHLTARAMRMLSWICYAAVVATAIVALYQALVGH